MENALIIRTFTKKDKSQITLEFQDADENGAQTVADDRRHFQSLDALVATHPELDAPEQLFLCCELILHFHRGAGFLPIADPDQYRARYAGLLQYDKSGDAKLITAGDFDPFDVSEIALPSTRDGKLVFYAEDLRYSLPYRIEAPWPPQEKARVDYLLLPLQQ